jgi:hypothetical protein
MKLLVSLLLLICDAEEELGTEEVEAGGMLCEPGIGLVDGGVVDGDS